MAALTTDLADLVRMREDWRRRAMTVVWTNGCFDLFHAGHVHLLERARSYGAVLVVGLNSDEAVRSLKGAERPFVPFEQRAAVLRGMRAVDHVLRLDECLPCTAIERLGPDVCVKDDTYATLPLPEREVVEAYGGRMVLVPRLAGLSTTALAGRLRAARPV